MAPVPVTSSAQCPMLQDVIINNQRFIDSVRLFTRNSYWRCKHFKVLIKYIDNLSQFSMYAMFNGFASVGILM